jgi:hypothetical protein
LYPFVGTSRQFAPNYLPSTMGKWKTNHVAKPKSSQCFSSVIEKKKTLDLRFPVALPNTFCYLLLLPILPIAAPAGSETPLATGGAQ